MSTDTKDLSASSQTIIPGEDYVYISITNPVHKGIWTDPAEFVWAIGDTGRNIILAGFLSHDFSPSEIATAFQKGRYHKELSTRYHQLFLCNEHDIVNAHVYMTKRGNVKFQQCFNEDNRKAWETVPEMKMEVAMWVHKLKKGTFFLWHMYWSYFITIFSTRLHRTDAGLHLVIVKNTYSYPN